MKFLVHGASLCGAFVILLQALPIEVSAAPTTWTVGDTYFGAFDSAVQFQIPDQPIAGLGTLQTRNQTGTGTTWTDGNKANFSGTFTTDFLPGSSIQFVSDATVKMVSHNTSEDFNAPSYRPDPAAFNPANTNASNPNGQYSGTGTAPAVFAGKFHGQNGPLGADAGYFAVRNVSYDVTSAPAAIHGTTFDATGVNLSATGNLDYDGAPLPFIGQILPDMKQVPSTVFAGANSAGSGTITSLGGGVYQMSLPINMSVPILSSSGINVNGTVTGSISATAVLHQADRYSLTDLGLGGQKESWGLSINDAGQVAGFTRGRQDDVRTGFVWDAHHGMTPLGTLPGYTAGSSGDAINNLGVVAATSSTGGFSGGEDRHAFLWNAGVKTDLGVLPTGDNFSEVSGMNDAGVVVGRGSLEPLVAMVWQPGVGMQTLNSVLDSTANGVTFHDANAVNNAGQVVGSSSAGGFLAQIGGSMQPIPLSPSSINQQGVVAGTVYGGGVSSDAAIWTSQNGLTDLGRLPGSDRADAASINDHNQVVGVSYYNTNDPYAFIWQAGSGMENLNALLDASGFGWRIVYANDINNAGQIVAEAIGPDGYLHAVVLTPGLPGDVNRDGIVNSQDIALISSNWLASGVGIVGDVNNDGIVNAQDIALVSSNWLATSGNSGMAASVPEPTALLLIGLGTVCGMTLPHCWRGRQRR